MSTTSNISTASYQSIVSSTEQLQFPFGAQPANISHTESNSQSQGNLGAVSSPPVAKVSVLQVSLSGGTGSQ